ncbi:MAG TPA: pyridoxal phosphate-dependent aminotransferase [Acidobacteriota bacterium]|nr:pyridoxal phosphate-dependent aminotransferase [Acidobacteriota bacterium]
MNWPRRVARLAPSPTTAAMELAQALKRQGLPVIDLAAGQPDFATPEPIREAGIRAIRENRTRYTPSAGLPELREALAEYYNRRWGTEFGYENVVVTAGAKSAVYTTAAVWFGPQDRVLIPAPYWVTFPAVVHMVEAQPVVVPTRHENRFRATLHDLVAVSPPCQGLILNTPNNPTGSVLPENTVEEVANWAADGNVRVLFDETYEHFVYNSGRHVSLASYADRLGDGFALIGSFSKTFAMTGWRIGYVIASREVARKIAAFQSHQSGNPSTIGQYAALEALRLGPRAFEPMRKEYEARLALVLRRLADVPSLSCAAPQGAFYVFPEVREGMKRSGCASSLELAERLLREEHVAVVAGEAFGCEGHIRISYAVSREDIDEALDRIRRFFEKQP